VVTTVAGACAPRHAPLSVSCSRSVATHSLTVRLLGVLVRHTDACVAVVLCQGTESEFSASAISAPLTAQLSPTLHLTNRCAAHWRRW